MEKSGLRFVRVFHQPWPDRIEGEEHVDVEYALTRDEWEAGPHAGNLTAGPVVGRVRTIKRDGRLFPASTAWPKVWGAACLGADDLRHEMTDDRRPTIGFPRMYNEPGERRAFLPPLIGLLASMDVEVMSRPGAESA